MEHSKSALKNGGRLSAIKTGVTLILLLLADNLDTMVGCYANDFILYTSCCMQCYHRLSFRILLLAILYLLLHVMFNFTNKCIYLSVHEHVVESSAFMHTCIMCMHYVATLKI